jgi:hypothetical protein
MPPQAEGTEMSEMQKLPNIDPEFIVVLQSAWMNDGGYGINYAWDRVRFNNRNDAIKHGLKTRGSDDFNIGQTYGDDLIWFGWMDRRIDETEDDMREIAEEIGLTFDPRWYRLEYSKATGKPIGFRDAA